MDSTGRAGPEAPRAEPHCGHTRAAGPCLTLQAGHSQLTAGYWAGSVLVVTTNQLASPASWAKKINKNAQRTTQTARRSRLAMRSMPLQATAPLRRGICPGAHG